MTGVDGALLSQKQHPEPAVVDEKAADNQRSDVRKVYLEHHDILLKWLIKTVGDAETAQDIAQASFLNLWIYAAKRPIERPKSLLFKTARNLAMNELRRRRRFSKRNVMSGDINDIDQIPENGSDAPSPEDAAALKQQTEMTLQLIDEMPARQQAAFKLHRFGRLSYKQIAVEIGVSESSVGKYIMEALKSLRSALV